MFHRKLVKFLVPFLLALSSLPAFAAEEYDTTIHKFFSFVGNNQPDEAADFLFNGNPWYRQSRDQIQNVKSQLTNLSRLVGHYKGQEKIAEEKVGSNYVYLVYLGLYERQPVRFKFSFYRPDEKWRFQTFSFDTDFSEDVAKQVNQKLLSSKPQ